MRRLDASSLRRLAVAMVLLLSVYAPERLSAQEESFRAAVSLASAGRNDSAKALLRRIVVEHANSAWADDALLQLAAMAFAAGNPAGVLEYAGRLRLDYPGSDLGSRAALWAGRAAIEAGEPRTGCALLDSATTESAGDVELANQIAFYRSRCAGLLAAAPPPRDTAAFVVQVAAPRSEAEANRIAAQYRGAGHTVRLSTSPEGFTRVRIGPFATREQAEAAIRAARDLTGGSPFIVRNP